MPTEYELRLEGAYKVVEWLRVRTREGHTGYGDADGLKCDLQHSSLIHWLCAGNEPLPEPPPVRHSRPDHRAAVDGKFSPFSVHPWQDSLIVENEAWRILEMRGPEEWIAAYKLKTDGSAWSAPWLIKRAGTEWSAERLSASRK